MTRRIADEPAYLLHLRPYRETSALLEVLTAHHGCVSVVGRGLRGRRRQSMPTPFVRLRVGMSGRSALLSLTALETETRHPLAGPALFSGLYLNELLLRLVRHDDPHPVLFDGYEETLRRLGSGTDVEPQLRTFEKLLLRECGYEVVFDVDAETGEWVDPGRAYRYVPDYGFTASDAAGDAGHAYPGAVLLAIRDDDYRDEGVRRAAKRILRGALEPHLGNRPLASRELFRRRGPA